jgi:hypothetical protein
MARYGAFIFFLEEEYAIQELDQTLRTQSFFPEGSKQAGHLKRNILD